MLEALNCCQNVTAAQTLELVRNSINNFVKEAPQFDDITMLCMLYK